MSVYKRGHRWAAKVWANGEWLWIGTFDTQEEAERAAQLGQPRRAACVVCGEPGAEVHHIDRDRANNRPENLIGDRPPKRGGEAVVRGDERSR